MDKIKKIGNSSVSENRTFYNEWVKKIKGEVLDIGKSRFWDYSDIPYNYKSLDINPDLKPDIVADICNNTLCPDLFDYVLCNGMWESITDHQKMVNEVYRILKPNGTAIFGFVGKGYKPYKKDWSYYKDGDIDFKKFIILEKKNFGDRYYFIICKKI